ncbi:glutathione S-transferase alpha-4-like [Diadema antillarum]|uniref:glutathione S-transferase alpha-4-like n=1 Tax=Diadema antillarum TaxID=105358 RepID=UPI003A89A13D
MAGQKPRLTYFDGRGFSEVTRLALSAAKIEFDDVYLKSRDEFLQLIKDGKLKFNQVPLLEMDGQNLTGIRSIPQYVCKKAGFVAQSEDDQAWVNMLCDGARDIQMRVTGFKFTPPEKQEEVLQYGIKEIKKYHLPNFEKTLAQSESGFLVGNSLTIADFMFFDGLSYINEIPSIKQELDDFPKCRAFIEHFSRQPGLSEYLSSPRRHPPPTDQYLKEVNLILGK